MQAREIRRSVFFGNVVMFKATPHRKMVMQNNAGYDIINA